MDIFSCLLSLDPVANGELAKFAVGGVLKVVDRASHHTDGGGVHCTVFGPGVGICTVDESRGVCLGEGGDVNRLVLEAIRHLLHDHRCRLATGGLVAQAEGNLSPCDRVHVDDAEPPLAVELLGRIHMFHVEALKSG